VRSLYTEKEWVQIPISDSHVATHRWRASVAAAAILTAAGLLSWFLAARYYDLIWCIIAAFAFVLVSGALASAWLNQSQLRVECMTASLIWFRGAHPDFLASLPESPYAAYWHDAHLS
jgi:hypothetical protein